MTDTVTTYIYSMGARRWYDIFAGRPTKGKVYITDTPRKSEEDLVLTIKLTPKQYVTIRRELGHSRDFNGEFIALNVSIFIAVLREIGIYVKTDDTLEKIAKNISKHKNYANKCVLKEDDIDVG